MRISTSQIYTAASQSMMEGQTKLADIQGKIASGKNSTNLADDPVAANQLVTLERELAQLDMFDSNIGSTRRRLAMTDTVLADLNNAFDRMRDLSLQARNATLNESDRIGIAYELKELVGFSANLMNTRDAKGEYLFSGSKGLVQSFQLDPGTSRYEYRGDATEREIQIGSAQYVQSTDSGARLFQTLDGNENVLNVALEAIEAIGLGSLSGPAPIDNVNTALDKLIDGLNATQVQMGRSVSNLGARLNGLDSAEASNTDFKLLTESTLSSVRDLDYAAASTVLAKRQLGLEAAYASFSKIQGLSLFNYIS